MNKSKVILVFIAGYLPGYKSGGPLVSLMNMIDAFGDDFDFRIVTADRDIGDNETYGTAQHGSWVQVGKAKVRYLAPEHLTLKSISRIIREEPHDMLYLNSFFNFSFSILPLIGIRLGLAPRSRIILAPRGEFSEGSLGLKSFKKRAFLYISRLTGLHRDISWQASTELEKAEIARVMPMIAKDVHVAKDLPGGVQQGFLRKRRSSGEGLRVVFFSRISPKKNLLMCLEVLGGIKVPVSFTIAGPKEDSTYWKECERALEALPSNVTVSVIDGVPASQVQSFLSSHDLFFLPTYGENYGHVIAEALEVGLRLLISDRTPWSGLSEAGIGFDLPLDNPEAFRLALIAEASAPPDDPEVTTRMTRAYLERNLQRERVRADNLALILGRQF